MTRHRSVQRIIRANEAYRDCTGHAGHPRQARYDPLKAGTVACRPTESASEYVYERCRVGEASAASDARGQPGTCAVSHEGECVPNDGANDRGQIELSITK